jgi:hypothetical protein
LRKSKMAAAAILDFVMYFRFGFFKHRLLFSTIPENLMQFGPLLTKLHNIYDLH